MGTFQAEHRMAQLVSDVPPLVQYFRSIKTTHKCPVASFVNHPPGTLSIPLPSGSPCLVDMTSVDEAQNTYLLMVNKKNELKIGFPNVVQTTGGLIGYGRGQMYLELSADGADIETDYFVPVSICNDTLRDLPEEWTVPSRFEPLPNVKQAQALLSADARAPLYRYPDSIMRVSVGEPLSVDVYPANHS